MQWSATFTNKDGKTEKGQISDDNGTLSFETERGTVIDIDELRAGSVAFFWTEPGQEPPRLLQLWDAAVVAGITVSRIWRTVRT